ncbi:MAG: hypothetical protein KBT72_10850 [Zhongshania sp.]|nr:hypothetical protein [Zhongshania sp.]
MNYLARQKIDFGVIPALYMLPSFYFGMSLEVSLALLIGLGILAFIITITFLGLLRADDYGSRHDYPTLVGIYLKFLGLLIWLAR